MSVTARVRRILRKPCGIIVMIIGILGSIIPGTPGLGFLFFVGIDMVFGTKTLKTIKEWLTRKRKKPTHKTS